MRIRRLSDSVVHLRKSRGANLAVANLRILIGFAFLPAAIKKVLGQPFTDADKVGAFHDFLHAFHAVGGFYQFVGVMQLVAALLLMTQRFATLGAVVALPILGAIAALCWASAGIPTTVVVTLMTLGTIGLLVWDFERWQGLFVPQGHPRAIEVPASMGTIDQRLWEICGASIIAVYILATGLNGGVYRPRGFEPGNPAFYLLPLIACIPIVTWLVERRRRAQAR